MSVDAARLTLQGRIPLRRFSPLSRGRSALPEAASGSRPLNLDELLAPESWVAPRRSNPELRKVLGVIAAHLGETRRLLALPKAGAASGRAAAVRELKSLVPRDASSKRKRVAARSSSSISSSEPPSNAPAKRKRRAGTSS